MFRYQISKKRRSYGFGPYEFDSQKLEKICGKAEEKQGLVVDGIDPHEHDRKQTQVAEAEKARGVTFKEVATQFIEMRKSGWRNAKHEWQWTRSLEMFAYPAIGEMAVAEIDTADIEKLLIPIWVTKNETANRVRNRISLILAAPPAATTRKQRAGPNPAVWRNHLDTLLPSPKKVRKTRNYPAMPWRELPTFWPKLVMARGISASAMMLTILTAARTSEVLRATWDEFDIDAGLWRLSADRMKAEQEHVVPLSDAAIKILRGQIGADENLVFPGLRKGGKRVPLSINAMRKRLERLRPGLTVHGFRSSFRDWAAEATEHQDFVAEKALAHAISDKVEKAYRRGDLLEKRRALMADWAAYVTTTPANNVVPIKNVGER